MLRMGPAMDFSREWQMLAHSWGWPLSFLLFKFTGSNFAWHLHRLYLFIPKISPISWFLLPTQNATLNQFLSISFIPFLPSATSTLQCFSCGSVFSIFLMLGWLLISVSLSFVVWSSCKFVVLPKGWVSACLAEQRLLWMKLNKAVTAGERIQD